MYGDIKYRNELKFLLNKTDAEVIKNSISTACFPDSHVSESGDYYIKSIYFDTAFDKCLNETLDGINLRHKYRIRKYGDKSDIKFEKKMSENGKKCKQVDIISQELLCDILNGECDFRKITDKPVLEEFLCENMMYMYKAVSVIGYNRIPYVYPVGNVRVTFDSEIVVSDDIDSFFDGFCGIEKKVAEDMVVLEVKYDDFLPLFISEILNHSGVMEQTSFSKYANARLALLGV